MLNPILKAGIIGGLGILSLGSVIESEMKKYNTDVLRPVDTVSIVIPSYNEVAFIGMTLSSLRNQSIIEKYPEYFELILADSCSTDGTIELAEPYVDRIIITPRGKLTSRNIATSEAKGNIVVSVDADCYYPYHWLNTLLEPFNDLKIPSIVGVCGSTLDYSFPNKLFVIASTLYLYWLNGKWMVGRNSAFYKHAFYLSGGFNENINQFNIWRVLDEEEELYAKRLSKYGGVIYKRNASCVHLGGMKDLCRLGLGDRKLCDSYKFGKERF